MTTIGPCPWTVRVPSDCPEPSSEADLWREVECGAPTEVVRHDPTDTSGWSDGWRCDNGHEHIPITIALAPLGPEWEAEQKERDNDAGF